MQPAQAKTKEDAKEEATIDAKIDAKADAKSEARADARNAAEPAVALADGSAADLVNPALYINRETSWLAFNARVLDQALDARWPLLERLKFLAIYSSNLDEFFMIRVSGLHEQLEAAALVEASPDGLSAREQLTRIGQIIRGQLRDRGDAAGRGSPAGAGRRAGSGSTTGRAWTPRPSGWRASTSAARCSRWSRRWRSTRGTRSRSCRTSRSRWRSRRATRRRRSASSRASRSPRSCRASCPSRTSIAGRSAAAAADGAHDFLPLEQLLAANLDELFPGMEILGTYPFRVTRDMDYDILEDEAHDLLSIVDREIRRRRFGACVRLEVAAGIPERVRTPADREAVDRRGGRLHVVGAARAAGAHADRRPGAPRAARSAVRGAPPRASWATRPTCSR